MKKLLRAFATIAGACGLLILVVLTFSIVKNVWFGDIRSGHVAVVEINGVIWNVLDTLREIETLTESESVKAIVVRINSPGGLVGPSQDLYEALKRTDKKKPVVISMGSVAASGGYYAALGGRKIFANPGTLTASIGVIMEFVNMLEAAQAKAPAVTGAKGRRKTAAGGKTSPSRE